VAPHHPLVAPQEFYDLYPTDQLPANKLHPDDGYVQHPWIAKCNDAMVGEDGWTSEEERRSAIAAYYGLVSSMDHNVGRIVNSLESTGLRDNTTVIYSSDHGENLGVRGLWGKMNSPPYANTAVTKDTPVSLLDVSETILDHFDAPLEGERPGQSLYQLAEEPDNAERVVFSEYHAIGAVSGSFMLRKGRYKLIEYVGFEPELFDLESDPDETENIAASPASVHVLENLRAELAAICDIEAVNNQAFADQDKMIADYGGIEIAATLGAPSATPPPSIDN